MISEETIQSYSKPLSDSEKQKCKSTISVLESILDKYGFTKKRIDREEYDGLNYKLKIQKGKDEFVVLIQGSYGNGTNIRGESDVDVSIICESTFRGNYPYGRKASDYGFNVSPFSILTFKYELANFISSIKEYKGKAIVNDKHIDFLGNGTSRKNMDIVPALRYRDYSGTYPSTNPNIYVPGVAIFRNNGELIINYPEQSIENNITKNKLTNNYYKRIVRVIKNIKADLVDKHLIEKTKTNSFGIECMLYNVPNSYFMAYISLRDNVISVLRYLLGNKSSYNTFVETNGLLYIFNNTKNNIDNYYDLFSKIHGAIVA